MNFLLAPREAVLDLFCLIAVDLRKDLTIDELDLFRSVQFLVDIVQLVLPSSVLLKAIVCMYQLILQHYSTVDCLWEKSRQRTSSLCVSVAYT